MFNVRIYIIIITQEDDEEKPRQTDTYTLAPPTLLKHRHPSHPSHPALPTHPGLPAHPALLDRVDEV